MSAAYSNPPVTHRELIVLLFTEKLLSRSFQRHKSYKEDVLCVFKTTAVVCDWLPELGSRLR